MSKLRLGMLVVAVICAVVTVTCLRRDEKQRGADGQPVLKTVRIGYQQTILYLPLFVAKERDLFKQHHVNAELVPFANAPDMMNALLARQIDATGMSALDVIANVEQENPGQLKLYLVEAFEPNDEYSPDYIIARPDSGIKKLADLKGKKLGIRPGTTIETSAKLILQKAGVAPEDVQLIPLKDDQQPLALHSGQIDALFTFDPVARLVLNDKFGEVIEQGPMAKYLMNQQTTIYPGSAVFASDSVKKDRDTVRAVRDALYEAVDWIAANPQEAKRLLPQYTPIASNIAEQVSLIKWVKVKDVDKEKVQELIKLYHDHGVLRQDVDLRNAYLTEADLK